MSWQDAILTAGSFVFIIALIPMVRAAEKPPLSTSASTTAVLISFLVVYASLGLVWSVLATGGAAALWICLFFQRLSLDRRASRA